MTSSTDFDELEVQQQYSNVNTRWECLDEDLDNDNSSARLFERSRIKALAGRDLDWPSDACQRLQEGGGSPVTSACQSWR
ncbi:UNVERIFIED_CONTAM: hypothetical protein FKN15_018795 [Acipenser sinensis]